MTTQGSLTQLEKQNQPKLLFDKELWNTILSPLIRAIDKDLRVKQ